MGCCCSTADVITLPSVIKPSQIVSIFPVQSSFEKKYFFGVSNKKQSFFYQFIAQTLKFIALTMPINFVALNLGTMTKISSSQYFIAGGINHDQTMISKQCYIYNSVSHTVSLVNPMHNARYTHSAVHCKQSVYILSGRYFGEDDVGILNSCERYSLGTKQWMPLPNMNVKRCTFVAVEFKSQIYVMGGYSGPFQRTLIIEKLNESMDKWEKMQAQLIRGIQGPAVFSLAPNQIMLFAGHTNEGPIKSIHSINLETNMINTVGELCDAKSLHKAYKNDNQIYILGGNGQLTVQVYDYLINGSIKTKMDLDISIEDFNDCTVSDQGIKIKDQMEDTKSNVLNRNLITIFGSLIYPCIVQINSFTGQTAILPISMFFKLGINYRFVYKNQQQIIFMGGFCDQTKQTVSKTVFSFDFKQTKATSLAPMKQERCNFAFCQNKSYIFVFGGTKLNSQLTQVQLQTCQKYDLINNKWQSLCSLPFSLFDFDAFYYHSTVFIVGGKSNKQYNKLLLIFNGDSWIQKQLFLNENIHIKAIFCENQQNCIMVGMNEKNNNKVLFYSFSMQNIKQQPKCILIKAITLKKQVVTIKIIKKHQELFLLYSCKENNIYLRKVGDTEQQQYLIKLKGMKQHLHW